MVRVGIPSDSFLQMTRNATSQRHPPALQESLLADGGSSSLAANAAARFWEAFGQQISETYLADGRRKHRTGRERPIAPLGEVRLVASTARGQDMNGMIIDEGERMGRNLFAAGNGSERVQF